MANRPRCKGSYPDQEPALRRWPHPIQQGVQDPEPMLHYIRCALSYQNQQLADIKALLQQVTEAVSQQADP